MASITKEWTGTEYFPIKDFHHVEFLVGNAKQAAYYYRAALGFECLAYRGPETGDREKVSYVLKQGRVRFVLTTPLSSRHPYADWLKKHGDGVHDVAFTVEGAAEAHISCLRRGAETARAFKKTQDQHGAVESAALKTYGDTIHSLVDDRGYRGPWAPGFVPLELPGTPGSAAGIEYVDHVVGNVPEGAMSRWKEYYERVFGFTNFVVFDEHDISTKYSALKSRVMRSKNWRVKLPINEPAAGLRKSQIDEFLGYFEGAGVQHVALGTGDILTTISNLRANGLEFLSIPNAYYEMLPARSGSITESLAEIKRLNILVDRDEEGYLLQLFTKPVQDRPTFFFEFIQRKGSRGFGQNNFQALFESIELEQERRGNLTAQDETCPST
ncbi:MAG: 4-hydroxyphenylpyruvate dioxygenase [Elusimicrobiota bacterium]